MSQSTMSEVQVVISIDSSQAARIAELRTQLSRAGLKQIRVMENVGVIAGQCAPDRLTLMRAIAGVLAVEISGEMQIAPPDSEVQ